jgi:hypothetical protein
MDNLHRHTALSRKGLLALGASGVATAAAGAVGPAAAFAAPQPPAPQGDDLGGPDAVGPGDFEVDLPDSSFATRDKALALGAGLEKLLVGVYLTGAGYAADPGTRLLIARLLTADGQLLGSLHAMAGQAAGPGLPNPMSTDDAGAALDKLITVPGSPGGR